MRGSYEPTEVSALTRRHPSLERPLKRDREGGMRALICGISGEDGADPARLLLNNGYEVLGRHAMRRSARESGCVSESATACTGSSMAANDFRSVLNVLRITHPQEIYNLAGQSSVGLSFEQPVETLESIAIGTINLLEAIRFLDRPIRFYSAGGFERMLR